MARYSLATSTANRMDNVHKMRTTRVLVCVTQCNLYKDNCSYNRVIITMCVCTCTRTHVLEVIGGLNAPRRAIKTLTRKVKEY